MRLFQNSGLYPSYLERLNQLASGATRFDERRWIFLADRFGALHFLKPVLEGDDDAFFTNGDDEILQRHWARENGIPARSSLEGILLAQIEHHRTEVFYNLDPMRYPSAFVRKLPGCVRKTLCWRAAPSGNADFTAYGAVLGNFPLILDSWRNKGCRAELFFPAVDPLYRTRQNPRVGGKLSRHPTGNVLPGRFAADPACGKLDRSLAAAAKASAPRRDREHRKAPSIWKAPLRADCKIKDCAEWCYRYGRFRSGEYALF
jgi:hypothetical protein